MVVWKFPFTAPVGAVASLSMPSGAEILHVGLQDSGPCFWALVDSGRPIVLRHFVILGTGHDFAAPPGKTVVHCGTVLTVNGAFVWHLFEIRDRGGFTLKQEVSSQ